MRSSRFVCLGWLLTAACADAAASAASTNVANPDATSAALPPVQSALSGMDAPPPVSAQAAAGVAAGSGGAPALAALDQAGSAAMSPTAAAAGSGEPAHTTLTHAAAGPSRCPAPPLGATLVEIAALNAVNTLRLAAGADCVNLDLTIGKAAMAHCAYYAMNQSADPMCTDNPHYEVMGCPGFTGAGPVERMHAAGFSSSGGGEVMAFLNDPLGAIQMWVDSVWHRIPILDPGTVILGYGAADGCDTIDFGPKRGDESRVVVYPFDSQTGVTTAFDGRYEGPMPPAPASGWPSANPISLYAQGLTVTEHQLFVDGDSTPLEHTWLDPTSPALTDEQKRALRNVVFMYGNTPSLPNTRYRVKMSGTYAGGALVKEWTFTTGAAPATPGFP